MRAGVLGEDIGVAIFVGPAEVAAGLEPGGAADQWLEVQSARLRALVLEFARSWCLQRLALTEARIVLPLLEEFIAQSNFDRALFGYLGWLSCRTESRGAAQACAALELLPSPPQVGGVAQLGELLPVCAERMLRESTLPADELARGWLRYQVLREELAVGRLGELLAESGESLASVNLERSACYSVVRPLEFGAAMGDCSSATLDLLDQYGTAIGEAGWFRAELRRQRRGGETPDVQAWAERQIADRIKLALAVLEEASQIAPTPRLALTRLAIRSSPDRNSPDRNSSPFWPQ
jgi:hypothetical protein